MDTSPSPTQHEVSRRIHILGVGSIGILVAHSLAGLPSRPPITLLLHRAEHLKSWQQIGRQKLSLTSNGVLEERGGFEAELTTGEDGYTAESDVIHNLIVTTKGGHTADALKPIAHRLRRDSTILFLQNGMGAVDEVNEKVFPEVDKRPNYMQGVISHGVYVTDKFSVVLAGMGTVALGKLRREPIKSSSSGEGAPDADLLPATSRYLQRNIVRTPTLAAVSFPYIDLLQLQLEKLAVNCVLNPMTGVLNCRNGELLYNFSFSRVMRLLLAEISLVIRALPELQGVSNVRMRFSPERLETLCIGVMTKTAKNVSSMLQDVRSGRQTEVEYINGYIVRRGEELGIKCALNYMIMHMVLGKQRLVDRQSKELLPMEMLNEEGTGEDR